MRDFAFLLANAGGAVPKMCIPSPAILHLVLAVRDEHFRLPAFYADEDDFMESLAAAYRKAIRAFYEQGCRYLQLDDTSWGTLSPSLSFAVLRKLRSYIVGFSSVLTSAVSV